MSAYLKIGDRLLDGEQILTAVIRFQLLETLIGQVLLDDLIEQIPLTQQEVFVALSQTPDAPLPDDFDSFLARWCEQQNVTPAYLTGVLLRDLRLEKFKQLRFGDRVESEFFRTKSDFDQVEFSLIQLTDAALAEELYFQLRDDKTAFAPLARQYTLGSERASDGWVGPVAMSSLPAEVAAVFRNGQEGKVYGPVIVADRFWVMRLERLAIAKLTQATRTAVVNRLYTQWLDTHVKDLIATPDAIAYGRAQVAAPEPSTAQTLVND